MRKPKKRAPGAGRKPEGRVRIDVKILPAAVKELDARKRGELNSRGKVIEALLAANQKTSPAPHACARCGSRCITVAQSRENWRSISCSSCGYETNEEMIHPEQ